MFIPDPLGIKDDQFCTSSEYLRIWKVCSENSNTNQYCIGTNEKEYDSDGKIQNSQNKINPIELALYKSYKGDNDSAPITSFDWNIRDNNIIGTCSIDTTCTIWDVETLTPKTQLIAHDKDVYDIAFAPTTNIFASCSADGSIRMFDLRSLSHSTILYNGMNDKQQQLCSLARISWNRNDHNYLATISTENSTILIIDIRMATSSITQLQSHSKDVTAISWAPHSSCHLTSCGDDSQVLIWDFTKLQIPTNDAYYAYKVESCINNVIWTERDPNYLAITTDSGFECMHL